VNRSLSLAGCALPHTHGDSRWHNCLPLSLLPLRSTTWDASSAIRCQKHATAPGTSAFIGRRFGVVAKIRSAIRGQRQTSRIESGGAFVCRDFFVRMGRRGPDYRGHAHGKVPHSFCDLGGRGKRHDNQGRPGYFSWRRSAHMDSKQSGSASHPLYRGEFAFSLRDAFRFGNRV